MKKMVFALQVFGLVAAFPLYIVSELNHVPTQLPSKVNVVSEKPESTVSKIITDTTVGFDFQSLVFKIN